MIPAWATSGLGAEVYAVLGHLVTGILILFILNDREETRSPLGWILAVIFLPWLAAPAYLIFGGYRVRQTARRRLASDRAYMQALASASGDYAEPVAAERWQLSPPRAVLADYPETTGNQLTVFGHGDDKYARLVEDIRSAEDHIHLAYYVWASDATGVWLRDLLMAKVREGVAVRVLYDAWGALWAGRFLRPLRDTGAEVRAFAPLLAPSTALGANLRNHRKIAVIDGQLAYSGGINIGDEYRGRVGRRLWKDLHLRLTGPAVRQVASVFAKDWFYVTREVLAAERYYPAIDANGPSVVRALPSGPGQYWRAFHETIFNAVSGARDWIDVVTPYYVPDQAIQMALASAARRGVRVRMLVPRHNNHPLVAAVSSSFYGELLAAGVAVFQSRAGMVHGKQVSVDGRWATVGSANLDARSFYLNYELNLIFQDQTAINTLTLLFEEELRAAEPITWAAYRQRPAWRKGLEGLARTISPML